MKMNHYRIIYSSINGHEYSYMADIDEFPDDCLEAGEWIKPFPNESKNSTVFGLVEYFQQSGLMPYGFGEIVKVTIESI